ncbi:hypothetical protein BDZ97DRAFT_2060702 [Flammula alnicola]|nr:hypothetical protein BDZ97DRAFT_2060702 [Flammula alnicola]
MATYTRYCIPLSKSTLLFFPPNASLTDGKNNETEGRVVLVTIKQSHQDTMKEITTFFVAQYEITKTIESLVFAHIFTYLPPEVRIQGLGYIITGKRKTWNYGKTLKLKWGEKTVRPCEDKWTFIFETVPASEK